MSSRKSSNEPVAPVSCRIVDGLDLLVGEDREESSQTQPWPARDHRSPQIRHFSMEHRTAGWRPRCVSGAGPVAQPGPEGAAGQDTTAAVGCGAADGDTVESADDGFTVAARVGAEPADVAVAWPQPAAAVIAPSITKPPIARTRPRLMRRIVSRPSLARTGSDPAGAGHRDAGRRAGCCSRSRSRGINPIYVCQNLAAFDC